MALRSCYLTSPNFSPEFVMVSYALFQLQKSGSLVFASFLSDPSRVQTQPIFSLTSHIVFSLRHPVSHFCPTQLHVNVPNNCRSFCCPFVPIWFYFVEFSLVFFHTDAEWSQVFTLPSFVYLFSCRYLPLALVCSSLSQVSSRLNTCFWQTKECR